MKLVLIYGPPAAGKLTVAKDLSVVTGYPLIDNHLVTDALLHLYPRAVSENDVPRAKLGRQIRLLIFESAAANDKDFITTFAPLADGAQDFMRNVKSIVEKFQGNLCLVQLLPNWQALEARVVGESRTFGKVRNVDRLRELSYMHPVMFEEFADLKHLVIDNSDMGPGDVARQICDHYRLPVIV